MFKPQQRKEIIRTNICLVNVVKSVIILGKLFLKTHHSASSVALLRPRIFLGRSKNIINTKNHLLNISPTAFHGHISFFLIKR